MDFSSSYAYDPMDFEQDDSWKTFSTVDPIQDEETRPSYSVITAAREPWDLEEPKLQKHIARRIAGLQSRIRRCENSDTCQDNETIPSQYKDIIQRILNGEECKPPTTSLFRKLDVRQSPTAHLAALRDPRAYRTNELDYLWSTLNNSSDAYVRLLERQTKNNTRRLRDEKETLQQYKLDKQNFQADVKDAMAAAGWEEHEKEVRNFCDQNQVYRWMPTNEGGDFDEEDEEDDKEDDDEGTLYSDVEYIPTTADNKTTTQANMAILPTPPASPLLHKIPHDNDWQYKNMQKNSLPTPPASPKMAPTKRKAGTEGRKDHYKHLKSLTVSKTSRAECEMFQAQTKDSGIFSSTTTSRIESDDIVDYFENMICEFDERVSQFESTNTLPSRTTQLHGITFSPRICGRVNMFQKFEKEMRMLPTGNETIIFRRMSKKEKKKGKDDVFFRSGLLSQEHCRIWRNGNKWYIKDLGSKHGTYVNLELLGELGKPSPPHRLRDGDVIQLGAMDPQKALTSVDSRERVIRMAVRIFDTDAEHSGGLKTSFPSQKSSSLLSPKFTVPTPIKVEFFRKDLSKSIKRAKGIMQKIRACRRKEQLDAGNFAALHIINIVMLRLRLRYLQYNEYPTSTDSENRPKTDFERPERISTEAKEVTFDFRKGGTMRNFLEEHHDEIDTILEHISNEGRGNSWENLESMKEEIHNLYSLQKTKPFCQPWKIPQGRESMLMPALPALDKTSASKMQKSNESIRLQQTKIVQRTLNAYMKNC